MKRTLIFLFLLFTCMGSFAENEGIEPALGVRTARYYYMPSCSSCMDFLLSMASEYSPAGLTIERIDVRTAAGYERMTADLERLGSSAEEFPILIIEEAVFQGEAETERGRREAEALLGSGGSLTSLTGTVHEPAVPVIGIGAIFLSGLIDGINPCVFSTLIFLFSMLAMLGRDRRDLIVIGCWYTLSVFISYYLAGLGLSHLTLFVSRYQFLGRLLDGALVFFLAILAVLSLYDYYLARTGRASGMVLQLSLKEKRRIHSVIRGRMRSGSLALGAVIMGVLVSLFELGCTGQIYLPTLLYMASVNPEGPAYRLLLLYNVGFILPLGSLFAVCIAGVSSKRLEQSFRNHTAAIKLLTAVLFIILLVLTLLS